MELEDSYKRVFGGFSKKPLLIMSTFIVLCTLIMPWIFIPIKGYPEQFRVPQGVFLDFLFIGMIIMFFIKSTKIQYKINILVRL